MQLNKLLNIETIKEYGFKMNAEINGKVVKTTGPVISEDFLSLLFDLKEVSGWTIVLPIKDFTEGALYNLEDVHMLIYYLVAKGYKVSTLDPIPIATHNSSSKAAHCSSLNNSYDVVWVRAYTKADGTHVSAHTRGFPNRY